MVIGDAGRGVHRWVSESVRERVLSNTLISSIMGTMDVNTHLHSLPKSRILLARVARSARPFVDLAAAAEALQWDRTRTAKQLARWHEQGFLRRIRRGVYTVVATAAMAQERVVADPWALVPISFRHAYIAGWSAAEHWDLTEQVFTTLLVCTSDRIKHTTQQVAGATIRARHVPQSWMFGTAVEWRDGARVMVSDVHKTIVDMCIDPSLGGGIQHVSQCLRAYLCRDDIDTDRLLAYANRAGSATAFKRLGFLCEVIGGHPTVVARCLQGVTLGLATLDPTIPSPRISKRWQLRLPKAWEKLLQND